MGNLARLRDLRKTQLYTENLECNLICQLNNPWSHHFPRSSRHGQFAGTGRASTTWENGATKGYFNHHVHQYLAFRGLREVADEGADARPTLLLSRAKENAKT